MAVDAMRIAVKTRKFMFFSTRTCYRSIHNHPILTTMVCFFIIFYKSSPMLFSLFVSASPVLVCTTLLLGTLLSFGKPNFPEIEKEEEEVTLTRKIDSILLEDDISTIVERNLGGGMSEESLYGGSTDCVIGEGWQSEDQVIDEMERNFDDSNWGKKPINDGKFVEDRYLLLERERDQYAEEEENELLGDVTQIYNGNFYRSSFWKSREEKDDDDDGNDGDSDRSSDPGSDGADSSSLDASMTDVTQMLDELHPFLDVDAPQTTHGSDDGSKRSHESDESSDDDSEQNIEKLDQEEEEERGKEGISVITWTETDQRNLMELGTIEIERNKRLESLIARRKLRKVMVEKNLINLDDADDLPFDYPTISTSRQNPFDLLPFESYNNMELPLIPPYDLPFNRESFQEEFAAFRLIEALQQQETAQQTEALFLRRESYSVGPSFLGGLKRDRYDDDGFQPYFVSERIASQGTGYHTLQRQLSKVSESKSSCVPDSESSHSAAGDEDTKLNQQDISQDAEFISNIDVVEHGSQSSDIDSLDTEQAEDRDVLQDEVKIVSNFSETGIIEDYFHLNACQIDLNVEPVEEVYGNRSSLSSLSKVDERISDIRKENPLEKQIEESHISTQISFAESNFQFTSDVADENQHREPLYDSYPPTMEKSLSFSSIYSDTRAEISGVQESEIHSERLNMDASSQVQKVNGDQSCSGDVKVDTVDVKVDTVNHDEVTPIIYQDLVEKLDSPTSKESSSSCPHVQELSRLVEHVSTEILAKEELHELGHLEECFPNKEDSSQIEQDQVQWPGCDVKVDTGFFQRADVEASISCINEIDKGLFSKLDSVDDFNVKDVVDDSTHPEELPEESSNTEIELTKDSSLTETHVELRVIEARSVEDIELAFKQLPEGVDVEEVVVPITSGKEVSSRLVSEHDNQNGHVALDAVNEYNWVDSYPRDIESVEGHVSQEHNYDDSNLFRQDTESEERSVEEHSLDKENSSQLEQDQVQSADVKASISGSGDLDELPEESFNEPLEPSNTLAESRDELSITGIVQVHESHDGHDKISTAYTQSDNPEYKSPTCEEDMKGNIFNQTVYGDYSRDTEQSNDSAETFGFDHAEQNTYQEAEIDEGLLSKLDSVGDFIVVDSFHQEELPGENNNTEIELTKESNLTETDVELRVLEARSVEEIELAFKKLHEGVEVEEKNLIKVDMVNHDVVMPIVQQDFAEKLDSPTSKESASHVPVPQEQEPSGLVENVSSEIEPAEILATEELHETEHVEEHYHNKEVSNQFEQDQVKSAGGDVKVDAGLFQSVDVEASISGSAHLEELSEESFDKPWEPSSTLAESRDDASITDTVHVHESQDEQDKISYATSDTTYIQSDSSEYNSLAGERVSQSGHEAI